MDNSWAQKEDSASARITHKCLALMSFVLVERKESIVEVAMKLKKWSVDMDRPTLVPQT